jgi:uncharacterized iron-regulated protein
VRYTLVVGAAALLAGCARASIAPWPVRPSEGRVVASATRLDISFKALADSVAKADVVVFGEMHDNAATHRAEAALLSAIGSRRKNVVVSLEMFERDVQPTLDAYLAGLLPESTFLARSRPWTRYRSDYRELVELAKRKKWPVVASNVPRPMAAAVSSRSLVALDSYDATQRAHAATDLMCPFDTYYERFVATMSGHSSGPPASSVPDSQATLVRMKRFYQAQCVKDETMAESIVAARARAKPGAIVVHFNGAFHSDYGLGTVERVRRRLPKASVVVISAVPVEDVAKAPAALHAGRGDYILFVPNFVFDVLPPLK